MKKKLLIFIFFIFMGLIVPLHVYAEDISYEDAVKAVKEVMQAWYMRGDYRQYNSSRNFYIDRDPENYTSQDTGYSVCSGFTNDVYNESFGMQAKTGLQYQREFKPGDATDHCNQTGSYISINNCVSGVSSSGCNGEYAIYYYKKDSNNQVTTYSYNNAATVDDLVNYLHPGDIVAYTGHVLIVYDIGYNNEKGKRDVLLLNSVFGDYIFSRISPSKTSTRRLMYFSGPAESNNGLIDLNVSGSRMINEGTVKYMWLSDVNQIINPTTGAIRCTKNDCSISRFFYKDGNNAVFNYDINYDQYKVAVLRTELPGMFVEKISSSYDNNSVYPGQTIEYSINITNSSNMKDGSKTYPKFYVTEDIPLEMVDYISSTHDGVFNDGSLTWNIDSLDVGETITLKYTVKVKDSAEFLNQKINATGKIYIDDNAHITTGEVSNTIIRKITDKSDIYKSCYDKNKNKTGLELIDEIYKCVWNIDFEFNKFDTNMFESLIPTTFTPSGDGRLALVRDDSNGSYYDMILNNYWNSLTLFTNSSTYYSLARWTDEGQRADTIEDYHFKNGDILIYSFDNSAYFDSALDYTKEDGIYAYIYLDGKFIGKNYTGDKQRDEFTYEYYNESERQTKLYAGNQTEKLLTYANYQSLFGKNYYVILRPEKIIKDLINITISKVPDKIEYDGENKIDLTGGIITLNYNDGTTEELDMNDEAITVTGYDKRKGGEQVITISYGDYTATYKINVADNNDDIISINPNTFASKNMLIVIISIILIIVGVLILRYGLYHKKIN